MTLPISRDENCVGSSPVKSSLINDIQDAIVSLYTSRVHAAVARHYPPSAFQVVPTNQPPIGTDPFLYDNAVQGQSNGGAAILPIVLEAGEKITAVTVYMSDTDGTHKCTARLRKVDMSSGAQAWVSNLFTSDGSGAIQVCALANITAVAPGANDRFELVWTITTAGVGNRALYGAKVTVDRL